MHVVKETLRELGITDKTIVTVFNKTDRLEESGLPIPRDFSADYQVRISAKNGDGLKELEEILGNIIRSKESLSGKDLFLFFSRKAADHP